MDRSNRGKDKKKRVCLGLREKMGVVEYLKMNKEQIEKGEILRSDACDALSRVLGVEVTKGHLVGPIQVVGVVFKRSYGRSQREREFDREFDREAIVTLTAAVTGLYIKRGETMPQALEGLKEDLHEEMQKDVVEEKEGVEQDGD